MGISQRAYARQRGVTHRAVQKAVMTGRITTNPDGTIDPARADAQWTANTDPARELRDELNERGSSEMQTTCGYLASRAVREAYRTRREKLAFERESGALVELGEVKRQAFEAARRACDLLMAIPDRAAPLVTGMSDQHEVHRLIRIEVERAVRELQGAYRGSSEKQLDHP